MLEEVNRMETSDPEKEDKDPKTTEADIERVSQV
jgi:hypothetical protein